MERQIRAKDLCQKLSDVIQAVQEEQVTYVVEALGQPRVAIVDLEQYRHFQQYIEEQGTLFYGLKEMVRINAAYNPGLSHDDIQAIIKKVAAS